MKSLGCALLALMPSYVHLHLMQVPITIDGDVHQVSFGPHDDAFTTARLFGVKHGLQDTHLQQIAEFISTAQTSHITAAGNGRSPLSAANSRSGKCDLIQAKYESYRDWDPYNDNGYGVAVHVIREYLPILKKYAANSHTVVEFGMRTGTSSWAILSSAPQKVISVDLHRYPQVEADLRQATQACGLDWTFVQSSDLEVSLTGVDMLFIDSQHTYDHVRQQLALHHDKVLKYICLHDTSWNRIPYRRDLWETIVEKNENPVWDAVKEFLQLHAGKWQILERRISFPGFVVLGRAGLSPLPYADLLT